MPMRTPTSSELLQLWESGFERSAMERSLSLLTAAEPEFGYARLARCTIGERDSLLLELRERLFGGELGGRADCPQCGTSLETHWTSSQLRANLMAQPSHGVGSEAQPLELVMPSHRIAYRLPNSEDLLAAGRAAEPAAMRQALLERCILSASCDGQPIANDMLGEDVVTALETSMANADPMADIEIALQCPACDHRWSATFDIASFLWSELHSWAQRLLVDVHKLARAYGWSESDILALSPARRALYVEMSGS